MAKETKHFENDDRTCDTCYNKGKSDLFNHYFKDIKEPVILSKEQFDKLIDKEDIWKMMKDIENKRYESFTRKWIILEKQVKEKS